MHFSWKILFYTVTVVDRHGGKQLSCAHITDESRHSCSRFVYYTYLCMRMCAYLPSTTSDRVFKNLYTREGVFFLFFIKKAPFLLCPPRPTTMCSCFVNRKREERLTSHSVHTYIHIYPRELDED